MPVTLPSCECVKGLTPFEKFVQIYAAAYVLAGEDESLPTVECVAGMPLLEVLDQIYCALFIASSA